MTKLPTNVVTEDDLIEWDRLKKELQAVKAKEILLRMKIFNFYFPEPKEGTNSIPLAEGWVLKAVAGYDRKVDIGAWPAIQAALREAGITHPEALVKYDPLLVVSEYRTLTEEQLHIMDQALIIKPSSPQMEIVLPKKAAVPKAK